MRDGRLNDMWVILPSALTTVAALSFFAIRNIHGWTFLPFGDEAAHLLGALALHLGDVLYRSYIMAHGPVTFILTQIYGALTGWHDLTYTRTISTALAALAGLSIGLSPALRGTLARLWATTLFFGVLASTWILQALYMNSYHPIAGTFVVIGLALFVAPAWLSRIPSTFHVFIAGVCFALVGFTAYSYAPAVVVLGISGLLPLIGPRAPDERPGALRRAAGALVLGGIAGSAIVLVWLAVFGDFLGFVVYHIVINQVYYSRYIDFTLSNFAQSFLPPVGPATIVHLIGLSCFYLALAAFLGLALMRRRGAVRSLFAIIIGFCGIALLNARGSTIFQDGTFLIAVIGAAAIAIPEALAQLGLAATLPRAWLATGLVATGVAGAEAAGRYAVATPTSYTRAQIVAVPPYHYGLKHDALYNEIRRIAGPDERVLALVYNPEFFLSVGRLPMNKYHEYLPWEADYAKNPRFGQLRDLCVDLDQSPPPIVYFDDWKVWDKYAPEQFMPCVIRILADKYQRQVQFPDLYVRKDRAAP